MTHIVLLSESIGAGHERAAAAIEEALREQEPGIRITRLNLLNTLRPRTAKWTRLLYMQALTRSPQLWGRWYEWQRDKEWSGISRSVVRGMLHKETGAWLRRLAPDAVICTHPLPACLLADLKRAGWRIPLGTVLTDYDMHGYWIHDLVDLYCLPIAEMASDLPDRVIRRAQVRVTGIPISPAFAAAATERSGKLTPARQQVLILGGGLGIGLLPIVEEITGAGLACDVTVICGRNQELRRDLQWRYGDHPSVNVLGYTSQMPRHMSESDLLVTKPGGLTVSEALAMRLPMVLFTPIPGQEFRNGRLLAAREAAVLANTPAEVAARVRDLLQNTESRERMKRAIEVIRHPDAAHDVAEAVLGLASRGSFSQQKIANI